MKTLQTLNGGYKRHMDYLLTLQSEVSGVQNALFKNLGHDLVLSGCDITDHLNGTVSISPGIVYVDGEIVRFAGADNVPSDGSKALTKGAPVVSDPDEFFDGSIKNTYKEVFAIVENTINSATQITIGLKLYDIRIYISDIIASYGQKGEIKDVYDLDGTFRANFDATGLGTTPKWLGWALFNGNNGGPNGSGRVRITEGKIVDKGLEYTYVNGQTGGEVTHKLTIQELPTFRLNYKGWGTYQGNKNGDNNGPDHDNQDFKWITMQTDPVGGDAAHNIVQPFVSVYTVIKIA